MTLLPQTWSERYARAPHLLTEVARDLSQENSCKQYTPKQKRSVQGTMSDSMPPESIHLPEGDIMLLWPQPSRVNFGRQSKAPHTISFLSQTPGLEREAEDLCAPEFLLQLSERADAEQLITQQSRIVLQIELGNTTMKALADACQAERFAELSQKIQAFPSSQRHTGVLQDIKACTVPEVLRTTYLTAKGSELVCLVLSTVVELAKRGRPSNLRNSHLAKAKKARLLLDKDVGSPPTLGRLARQVGLNRSKLAACFKHLYGCGVYEYSRRERLLFGRRLLAETEASVSEIALATGYETVSSFSKSFKSEFGVSPRACRAGMSRCV